MHIKMVVILGSALLALAISAARAEDEVEPKGYSCSFTTGTASSFKEGVFPDKAPEPLSFTITAIDLDKQTAQLNPERKQQARLAEDRARDQRQSLSRGRQRGLPQSDDHLRQGRHQRHLPGRALASFRRASASRSSRSTPALARRSSSDSCGCRLPTVLAIRSAGSPSSAHLTRLGRKPWRCTSSSSASAPAPSRSWPTGRPRALAERKKAGKLPRIFHTTFQTPKRDDELLAGGSIYWVIKGTVQVRQKLIGFEQGTKSDGKPALPHRARSALVPVRPVPRRAFQGWRYLTADDAPADLGRGDKQLAELPPQDAP